MKHIKGRLIFAAYKLNKKYSKLKQSYMWRNAGIHIDYNEEYEEEPAIVYANNSNMMLAILYFDKEDIDWCTEDPKARKAISELFDEMLYTYFDRLNYWVCKLFNECVYFEEDGIYVHLKKYNIYWETHTNKFSDVEIVDNE